MENERKIQDETRYLPTVDDGESRPINQGDPNGKSPKNNDLCSAFLMDIQFHWH